jgi:DivIVA domain-containing protein
MMFKPEDRTVTPQDLRQTQFTTAMRGYNKAEVSALLLQAADDYEQTLRENERLRQELSRSEAALAQARELEASLKSTLVSAQKITDDIRAGANQEAARILHEAEESAALLRLRRQDAQASIEAIIASLSNALEFVRAQESRERDAKVQPIRIAGR